ncbi:hypothetical protein [Marinimicrobium locisalis]|uniref:hypothetical protein n=1 Tax=Marinimicrobium locisalis TaxID=546022 RepID=UPI003221D480
MKIALTIVVSFISISANAKSALETQIILFESSCIEYYEGVIDRKVGNNSSPEERKKWEDTLFKDYKFSKNPDNPEKERLKRIKQANIICETQRKLGI